MTAALIIAAGKTASKDDLQPMKPVGFVTAVQRLIIIFQQAGIEKIVLVSGRDAEKLERHVARMGVICLRNENPDQAEMLDSVKIGLSYLQDKCDAAMITPVDIPLFSVETIYALKDSQKPLVIPLHDYKPGHPLFLSQKLFQPVLEFEGDRGLAGAIDALEIEKQYIDVDDEGILLDVQRDDTFEELVESHSLHRLHADVRVRLAREQAFFGPGTQQLLLLVEETESLRLACQQMGLSYSKGWKMVSAMEQQLGFAVLDRQQGGKHGGRSTVTQKGKQLLETYQAFSNECKQEVNRIFQKYFPDEPDGPP